MKNEEIIKNNIIPHLKSLKDRATRLKKEANDWEISPNYKRGFPKYEILTLLIETVLGQAAFVKINELLKKLPPSLKLKYLFQYEFLFLITRFGLIQAMIEVELEKGNTDTWDKIQEYADDWKECLIILEHLSFLLFKKGNTKLLKQEIVLYLKSLEDKATKLKNETCNWELSPNYKREPSKYRPFYRILNLVICHNVSITIKNLFEENKSQLAGRFREKFSRIANECQSLRISIEKNEGRFDDLKNIQEYADDWKECLIILEHLSSLLFKK